MTRRVAEASIAVCMRKITMSSHIQHLWTIVIYLSVAAICPVLFSDRLGEKGLVFGYIWAGIAFGTFISLHLLIHLKYYSLNKGASIRIPAGRNSIVYSQEGMVLSFSSEQIARAVTTRSMSAALNSLQLLPSDAYSYTLFELKDGRRLWVTSLLYPELNWPVGEGKLSERSTLFPWPLGASNKRFATRTPQANQ